MLSAQAILMRSTVAGLSKGKSVVAPQSLLQAVTSLCHVMSHDITCHVSPTHLEAAIASLMAKKTLLARNSGGSPMALRRGEEKGGRRGGGRRRGEGEEEGGGGERRGGGRRRGKERPHVLIKKQ